MSRNVIYYAILPLVIIFVLQCSQDAKVNEYLGVELYPGARPVEVEPDSLFQVFPGCYAETLKGGTITIYGKYIVKANWKDILTYYADRMGPPKGPKKAMTQNDKFVPPVFMRENTKTGELVKVSLVPNEQLDTTRIYINKTKRDW